MTALVILDRGAASTRLRDALTGRGWRVWVADGRSDDLALSVAGAAAFLAAPESPDRLVLLGHDAAGLAAMEIADRHPERAMAVVAVGTPAPAVELACPTVVLPAGRTGAVVSAVQGLGERLAAGSAPAPAPRPPSLAGEALEIARAVEYRPAIGLALARLGDLSAAAGDRAGAARRYRDALDHLYDAEVIAAVLHALAAIETADHAEPAGG